MPYRCKGLDRGLPYLRSHWAFYQLLEIERFW
jgi:hypothetical protein